jgi:hypothetical protein
MGGQMANQTVLAAEAGAPISTASFPTMSSNTIALSRFHLPSVGLLGMGHIRIRNEIVNNPANIMLSG